VKPLGPSPSADLAAELADLVERLTARVKAGQAVDLDELAAEHPAHADELRRIVPAMKLLADLSQAPGSRSGAAADGATSLAEPLGDFHLLREVGRGGMGIVYEALQRSLNRRVALKVLPFAATMDPKQLQRFKNEALAAASLRHEHIVHVYGVGCERGVHYYAMEFIDGLTLAQVIAGMRANHPASRERQRPEEETATHAPVADAPGSPAHDTHPVAALSTELNGPKTREFYRTAARWIAEAATALEHAHSLGIVHRDVKPGNLIVDQSGELWVTDFGLARFGPGAGLTMTGDLLGTLRYMAPEQALTRHGLVDHRADVYSTRGNALRTSDAAPGGGRDGQT
jgi:eukaryotic-like serine/threonine-protein kinase